MPADLSILTNLGLTPLEAEVYLFLTSEPAATGYRIAQAIGKPAGNVYKALEGLEAAHAILTADQDGTQIARAVPIEELVSRLRKRFEANCTKAVRVCAVEREEEPDHAVYRLTDRDQAIERALAMIACATEFVIVNATPSLIPDIATAMTDAARSGAAVAIKAFEPVKVEGVDVILDPRGSSALLNAPGEWLQVTTDGKDVLCALTDRNTGTLLEGFWTRNPLLAWTFYSGMSSDVLLAGVRGDFTANIDPRKRLAERTPLENPRALSKLSLIRTYRPSLRGSASSARRKDAKQA